MMKRKSSRTISTHSISPCRWAAATTSALLIALSLTISPADAFVVTQGTTIKTTTVRTRSLNHPFPPPSCSASSSPVSTTTLRMMMTSFVEHVSEFYATYPLESAVLTCGLKASLADGIAQWKQNHSLQGRRNLAYVIYGGFFVGLMCHLEYNHLFPLLFGNCDASSWTTLLQKVIFDNFITGPILWLPPAYFIKAAVYEHEDPIKEGWDQYWLDVTQNSLWLQYWMVWVPAQTVSFSLVPDHLRVAFMAFMSFFWFILFSTVAGQRDNDVNYNHSHKIVQRQVQTQPLHIPMGTNATIWAVAETSV